MTIAKAAPMLAFLACIVAANYATTTWGLIPIGFGLVATAGTFFAGATFVLRDLIQDQSGRGWVVFLIIAGAGLSFLLSAPFIALASGIAFLVSEMVDFAIYTPLRRKGYIRAAVASNIAGCFVDTVIFLAIAGFPIWSSVPGQMMAKLSITWAVVAIVWGIRVVSRKPQLV